MIKSIYSCRDNFGKELIVEQMNDKNITSNLYNMWETKNDL